MTFIVLHSGDQVRNMEGTAYDHNPCQSWKQYWMQISPQLWPSKCSISGCGNRATDGAHVWVRGKRPAYILPMCNFCNVNRPNQWLLVNSNSIAVQIQSIDTNFPYAG